MRDDRSAPSSDASLVEAARHGERRAFDQLLERHLPQLWRVVWRIVRQDLDAADVVRESALAAHRALPAYGAAPRYSVWLLKIAVMRALKVIERRELISRSSPPPDIGPATPYTSLNPAGQARQLALCRAALPPPLRGALVLRDGEQLGAADVEEILSLPEAAVRARIARARTALWRCLERATDGAAADRRLAEALSGYLDGELTAVERVAIERTVASRPDAQGLLDGLRLARQLGGADEDPPPPADLLERIVELLPAAEVHGRWRPERRDASPQLPVRAALVALAALAAVVVGGWWLVSEGRAVRLWADFSARMTADRTAATPPTPDAATPQRAAETAETAAPPAAPNAPPRDEAVASSLPTPIDAAPPPISTPAAGGCTATWQLPGTDPLPWAGPPPANTARDLGWLAVRLNGRGILQGSDPPSVRLTVPRDQWRALVDELQRLGVAVASPPDPPAYADCVAVVVHAPAAPAAPAPPR